MRPDIKLGVAVSMVAVLVAGTYFLYRDKRDKPIVIADGSEVLSKPVAVAQSPRTDITGSRKQRLSTGDEVRGPTPSNGRDLQVTGQQPARSQPGQRARLRVQRKSE